MKQLSETSVPLTFPLALFAACLLVVCMTATRIEAQEFDHTDVVGQTYD